MTSQVISIVDINGHLFKSDMYIQVGTHSISFKQSWYNSWVEIDRHGKIRGNMSQFSVAQTDEILRIRDKIYKKRADK